MSKDNSVVERLKVNDCWIYTPRIFKDDRGSFLEWFQDSTFLSNTGSKFNLAQANISKSAKGVIRGIHFAKNPPGQAKYVTCLTGKVFDVVVDLRKGSPTFGKWDSVILDAQNPKMLYVPSGIGHGFMALEDDSTFVYLCDQRYNPNNEFDISPFDEFLDISWPSEINPMLSLKDESAMNFHDLIEIFPNYESK